ncbi:peptidase [Metallosphaera tengchongensis]|uniref:Peptidase n=1 Tax=Metallosphaera tengchongensis TaxID=1532350 RepID=A0A6N0NVD5_9CREN|nr:metallopeptidase TldD-related protein [Metallosphaera tengchongensis]QKQ99119.1 peptidase [Metallosphaera tengchongensis]
MRLTVSQEQIIKESNGGTWITYESKSETTVTRYISESGWTPSVTRDPKPEPLCKSFIHNSVSSWEKARKVLERINEGNRIEIRKVTRKVQWEDYECVEEKVVNFISFKGRKFAYTGDPNDIPSVLEFLREEKDFRPSPVFVEKATVILDPDAVSNLLVGLVSMLRGDSPQISSDERGLPDITLYDEPTIPYSHAFAYFDDEGVATNRKELIGNGQVINYLGTRTTKVGSPGNARGFVPKPDFFNMVLKPGDWKLNELIQESKNAFLVMGSHGSELVKKSLRIRPRRVIQLGGGEISLRELAVPLAELSTLDAVTADSRFVYLDDDHGALAPFVRLRARFLY